MPMTYEITYNQYFMGEYLESSYTRIVNNDEELEKIVEDLYSDPHVTFVTYTPVASNREGEGYK